MLIFVCRYTLQRHTVTTLKDNAIFLSFDHIVLINFDHKFRNYHPEHGNKSAGFFHFSKQLLLIIVKDNNDIKKKYQIQWLMMFV